MKTGKRGIIASLIYISVFLFALAVAILIGTAIYDSFVDNTEDIMTEHARDLIINQETTITMWDELFVIIFVSLGIGMIVLNLLIPSHPVFFIIGVIVLAVGVVLAGQFSNMYDQLANDTTIGNYTRDTYPLMTSIMNDLPWYIVIFGIIAVVAYSGVSSIARGNE